MNVYKMQRLALAALLLLLLLFVFYTHITICLSLKSEKCFPILQTPYKCIWCIWKSTVSFRRHTKRLELKIYVFFFLFYILLNQWFCMWHVRNMKSFNCVLRSEMSFLGEFLFQVDLKEFFVFRFFYSKNNETVHNFIQSCISY